MSSNTARFIRFRDAPHYLGMDKNRFNDDVRPLLVEIPIGVQGIAFDRHDLDKWADDYKKRFGVKPDAENDEWQDESQDYETEMVSGTLKKESTGSQLTSLLTQAKSKKRKKS